MAFYIVMMIGDQAILMTGCRDWLAAARLAEATDRFVKNASNERRICARARFVSPMANGSGRIGGQSAWLHMGYLWLSLLEHLALSRVAKGARDSHSVIGTSMR